MSSEGKQKSPSKSMTKRPRAALSKNPAPGNQHSELVVAFRLLERNRFGSSRWPVAASQLLPELITSQVGSPLWGFKYYRVEGEDIPVISPLTGFENE